MKKVLLLILLGASWMNAANLLVNPGFEDPSIPPTFAIFGTGSTGITGWTVTGAACGTNCILDLTNTYTEPSNIGTINFLPHSGIQSLDLTGAGNTLDGGVQQLVNLVLGTSYTLSFWVGNMDNAASGYPNASTIQVFLNNSSLGSFTNNDSTANQTNWKQFSLSFVASTTANTVRFTQATPGTDAMAGLDDVFLDATPGAGVPEPATFAFAAAGLALLTLAKYRRR